jgi:hypothetical protein
MRVAVVTEGLEEVTNRLTNFADVFSADTLASLVLDAADIVIEEVKPNLPIAGPEQHLPKRRKRGILREKGLGKMLLKRAVDAGPDSQSAGVGFTKKGWFGIYGELGTVHEPARPQLIPGFERKKADIVALLGNFVTQAAQSWNEGVDMNSFRRIKQ